jgi:hypothetical protein
MPTGAGGVPGAGAAGVPSAVSGAAICRSLERKWWGFLGFGDIPARAFLEAFNMVGKNGFVAFNIKETFLDRSDDSGFSQLVRELIFSEYLDLYHLQRYRHRFSIEGEPLYYFALGGRKTADVPPTFLEALDLSAA